MVSARGFGPVTAVKRWFRQPPRHIPDHDCSHSRRSVHRTPTTSRVGHVVPLQWLLYRANHLFIAVLVAVHAVRALCMLRSEEKQQLCLVAVPTASTKCRPRRHTLLPFVVRARPVTLCATFSFPQGCSPRLGSRRRTPPIDATIPCSGACRICALMQDIKRVATQKQPGNRIPPGGCVKYKCVHE